MQYLHDKRKPFRVHDIIKYHNILVRYRGLRRVFVLSCVIAADYALDCILYRSLVSTIKLLLYYYYYTIIIANCSIRRSRAHVMQYATLFSGNGYRLYNDIRFLLVPWTSLQTICMPYVYILLFSSTKITDCLLSLSVPGGLCIQVLTNV